MEERTTETLGKKGVREFKLEEVSALQIGRITQLTHPLYGVTYLIDTTDREDPTRKDPGVPKPAETAGEVFFDREENPEFQNRYAGNNNVVVLITDRLDRASRYRVYSGVAMVNPEDKEGKEITSRILRAAGFTPDYFYVPFSFDSRLVREYMEEEAREAVKELGPKEAFALRPLLKRTF